MALINCHECGKQISTTAKRCPYCGVRPLRRAKRIRRNWIIVGSFLLVAMIFGGLFWYSQVELERHAAAVKSRMFLESIKTSNGRIIEWKDY